MLDVSNVISGIAILVKFIKAYDNFFAEPICFYFHKSLENGKFTGKFNWLKLAIITPVFKNGSRTSKTTIDQLVFSFFFKDILKVT